MTISNSRYLKIYAKDQKFIDPFDSFLFANLALSLSVFIFFSYTTFISQVSFEIFSFLKLLLTVSALIIIKTLLERLIGSLFDMDYIIDDYLFQKTTFKNISGIVLLTTNIGLIYTNGYQNVIIIVTICLIAIINLIGFIGTFKNHQKAVIPNFFYFLLYLCALEIGPYIVLYKVIRAYNT